MTLFALECLTCHSTEPASVFKIHCSLCGGLFRIKYQESADGVHPNVPTGDLSVTLGEGSTPVIQLRRTAQTLGLDQLWGKLEFMAPTGSFKDRGSAILVSAALNEGVSEFVEDSSGNAGASLSAYAAAASMRAHVFVPASAARGKLDQIRIFGAELHAIEGPRQAATEAAERFVAETGLPYLSHNLSPYFAEGMKAVSYEIANDVIGDIDHIVLPVGNGSMLIGAKSGFDDLIEAGRIADMPRFHAVQAENVMPITAAINGGSWKSSDARPTVASGIAVSQPPRLQQCVDAVNRSCGSAVAVPDASAFEWQGRLADNEGIFCEITSAAAFAGLEKLIATGEIQRDEPVLVPITGSGLKEPVRES